MRKLIWLLALVPSVAYAEVPCMPLDAALSELTGPRYNEVPLFDATLPSPSGAGAGDVTISATANAKTGTWTLIVRPNSQMACILMAGKDFRPSTLSVKKPGKPL